MEKSKQSGYVHALQMEDSQARVHLQDWPTSSALGMLQDLMRLSWASRTPSWPPLILTTAPSMFLQAPSSPGDESTFRLSRSAAVLVSYPDPIAPFPLGGLKGGQGTRLLLSVHVDSVIHGPAQIIRRLRNISKEGTSPYPLPLCPTFNLDFADCGTADIGSRRQLQVNSYAHLHNLELDHCVLF